MWRSSTFTLWRMEVGKSDGERHKGGGGGEEDEEKEEEEKEEEEEERKKKKRCNSKERRPLQLFEI